MSLEYCHSDAKGFSRNFISDHLSKIIGFTFFTVRQVQRSLLGISFSIFHPNYARTGMLYLPRVPSSPSQSGRKLETVIWKFVGNEAKEKLAELVPAPVIC